MAGIVGSTAEAVCDLLGSPPLDRVTGADRWLIYRYDEVTLRIRCHREASAAISAEATRFGTTNAYRVVSWTATFAGGRARLKEVAVPLGLWPACGPDVGTGDVRHGLLRRALADPAKGVIHSLTASVRNGLIQQISVFDEPPEWEKPATKRQV